MRNKKVLFEKFRNDLTYKDSPYVDLLPYKETSIFYPIITSSSKNDHHTSVINLSNDQFENNGIVKRISNSGISPSVHYLPHHPVLLKERDTTKLCIFYPSSRTKNTSSLNDCIYSGHSLLAPAYSHFIEV